MIYLLLALNIILLVFGQTLWKLGLTGSGLKPSLSAVMPILFNPYILGGLVIYALATVIWLYILSQAELSLVYPLQSLSYVAAAFIAMFVFNEHLPFTRWIGIGFIVLGAYFVSIK